MAHDVDDPGFDYAAMVQEALLVVPRRCLAQVAREGLPGDHHFYLTFATSAPGVEMSNDLRSRFPDSMTVVLQHDFRDLEVDDDGFSVTLHFSGVPRRLHVPFTALTTFFDPSVPFALSFQPDLDVLAEARDLAEAADGADEHDAEAEAAPRGDKVVSLDAFRRK